MKKSPHSLWDCVVMFFYPPPSLRDTSASGGHEKKKPRRGNHPRGLCGAKVTNDRIRSSGSAYG